MANKAIFKKDPDNRKLWVTREFDAPVEKVWKAWTEREILDKWWAPKPWKAETKEMNFTEGGIWLYSMLGLEGERHWSRVDIKTVVPGQSFSSTSKFSDENGVPVDSMPGMGWFVQFFPTATGTKVEVELSFATEASMNTMMQMGFEGGFTMGLNNLEELLASE